MSIKAIAKRYADNYLYLRFDDPDGAAKASLILEHLEASRKNGEIIWYETASLIFFTTKDIPQIKGTKRKVSITHDSKGISIIPANIANRYNIKHNDTVLLFLAYIDNIPIVIVGVSIL